MGNTTKNHTAVEAGFVGSGTKTILDAPLRKEYHTANAKLGKGPCKGLKPVKELKLDLYCKSTCLRVEAERAPALPVPSRLESSSRKPFRGNNSQLGNINSSRGKLLLFNG